MDANRPTFILEEFEDNSKPLPYSLPRPRNKKERVKLPDNYPKFEVEFYDVIKSCAEYIDKINCLVTRVKYNKELNKIFIIRHRGSAMRLFKELFDLLNVKGGEHHGKNS